MRNHYYFLFLDYYYSFQNLLLLNYLIPSRKWCRIRLWKAGFHFHVDGDDFPSDMKNARSDYISMIDAADHDALFEERIFVGSRVFDHTDTMIYEIMLPPDTAVACLRMDFPWCLSTYGRTRLVKRWGLDAIGKIIHAYVVFF